MAFKFEKLKVWQEAVKFASEIYCESISKQLHAFRNYLKK